MLSVIAPVLFSCLFCGCLCSPTLLILSFCQLSWLRRKLPMGGLSQVVSVVTFILWCSAAAWFLRSLMFRWLGTRKRMSLLYGHTYCTRSYLSCVSAILRGTLNYGFFLLSGFLAAALTLLLVRCLRLLLLLLEQTTIFFTSYGLPTLVCLLRTFTTPTCPFHAHIPILLTCYTTFFRIPLPPRRSW